MFDIGWSELLVIAIVLIVVVGPKDLPPMIRAFGKTMAGLRKMAGEFRSQFDEALKEADMDDVRQTISDVRNLNPTNSLRDAMNPLRQLGNDIRSDLQKAATPPSGPATSAPVDAPAVSLSDPQMSLPDTPPPMASAPVATPVPATAAAAPAAALVPDASSADPASGAKAEAKARRSRKSAAKSVQEAEAEAVAQKPKRQPKTVSAKAEATKPKRASAKAKAAGVTAVDGQDQPAAPIKLRKPKKADASRSGSSKDEA